jgi:hypothetical protein
MHFLIPSWVRPQSNLFRLDHLIAVAYIFKCGLCGLCLQVWCLPILGSVCLIRVKTGIHTSDCFPIGKDYHVAPNAKMMQNIMATGRDLHLNT